MNAERIVDLALREFNRRPGATMGEIATAVGVSRATLHRHFSSRDALLERIAVKSLDRWEAVLEEAGTAIAAESDDPVAIEAALRALLEAFATYAEDFGFVLTEDFLFERPELRRRAAELLSREAGFYEAAQARGVLRDDLPPRWLAHASFGLMLAAREARRAEDVARADLERLFLATYLHGASPG